VKNLLGDAKSLIENAEDDECYEKALSILNKAIMKASSVQVSNSYHLHYYRGLCYLNLNNLDKAERDFVESISLADEKGKIQIYNSLGKCKIEMSAQDPSYLE
jgi:tetratricopeptide (TPR) repeat protein